MKVLDILKAASVELSDHQFITYTLPQLLNSLNSGQRAIATLVPSASIKTGNIPLVAGTRQTLPADAVHLLRLTRNRGVAGDVDGNGIRLVNADMLNLVNPGWAATTGAEVEEYMYSESAPKEFIVKPRLLAAIFVEGSYASVPAPSNIGGNLTLGDEYAEATRAWVLYESFARDSELTPNYTRAARSFERFFQLLNLKVNIDMATNPNVKKQIVST